MNRLLSYMLKLPVGLFVAGMDMFLRSMREFQGVFEEVVDDLTNKSAASVASALSGPAADATGCADWHPGPQPWGSGANDFSPFGKEKRAMASIDLGGDDVKNVTYWISFVKPDFVATLTSPHDETIDYATDEGSYGGLIIGKFFEDLKKEDILWPKMWGDKVPSPEYKRAKRWNDRGQQVLTDIPEKDRKYLRFHLRLNWRQPQPDAEREKDKVDVLREIRDAIRKEGD